MSNKKLFKVEEGKMLFGVCNGYARFFNIDPTIIRLVFAGLSFFGGAGVILYLISAIIMPQEN